MTHIPNWPHEPQQWDDASFALLLLERQRRPEAVTEAEIEEASEKFPVKFPIETVRCKYLRDKIKNEILERNINSLYPVMHEKALYFCAQFLLHKKHHGSSREKAFYRDMSLTALIDRLLKKKAVIFLGALDHYELIDGKEGFGEWEKIGAEEETERLKISNCLSYHELKLSALLSLSSYTSFVNNGKRRNMGKWEDRVDIEDEGIIIGLVGTRLVKANAMESEEIISSPNQSSPGLWTTLKTLLTPNSTGEDFKKVVANFYEENSSTYEEVVRQATKHPERYEKMHDIYFDNTMYSKRMSLSFDTLLLEANQRAKDVGKFAFVHTVGLGLGVWRAFGHQPQLFLEIFTKRLQFLGKTLTNISDIFFDYFPPDSTIPGMENGKIPSDNHPLGGITIHIGSRNPHQKLKEQHQGKLLVVSYAADSNSLPGNEFWGGALYDSSDSAAASSTQITELHNPFINKNVCVGNLRIATFDGVLHIEEYIESILSKRK